MTQRSRFWDGTATGDATEAPYDAATEFARVMQSISGGNGIATNLGGVFRGELNELAVTGAASPVAIDTGRAINYGTWFENDASTTIAIPTPAASTRVDVIVLRKDWVAQTVRIVRVAGTEGAGVPAITQVAGVTWDIPLANVSIVITTGVITLTDRRQFLGSTFFQNVRSFTAGDTLYADTTTTLAKLGIGAANSVMRSTGTAPAWTSNLSVSAADVRAALGFRAEGGVPTTGGAALEAWVSGGEAMITAYNRTGAAYVNLNVDGAQHVWRVSGTDRMKLAGTLLTVYQVPEARVYNNANISLTNNVEAALTFNTERYDTDAIHDTGSNTGRLTCKTAGKYRITAYAAFAPNTSGARYVGIYLNGTTWIALDFRAPVGSGLPTGMTVSAVWDMAVNDYVEVRALQDSGGALNINASTSYSPEFSMERVG